MIINGRGYGWGMLSGSAPDFAKKALCVHPLVNGYLTLFRAGEREGDEEKEWDPAQLSYRRYTSPSGCWLRPSATI